MMHTRTAVVVLVLALPGCWPVPELPAQVQPSLPISPNDLVWCGEKEMIPMHVCESPEHQRAMKQESEARARRENIAKDACFGYLRRRFTRLHDYGATESVVKLGTSFIPGGVWFNNHQTVFISANVERHNINPSRMVRVDNISGYCVLDNLNNVIGFEYKLRL